MAAKDVRFGDDARHRMVHGVNILLWQIILADLSVERKC